MNRRVWCATGLAALALCAPGGARAQAPAQSAPSQPPAPASPSAPANPVDTIRQGLGVDAPVDPNGYKIGVEDVIAVMVWKEPDHSGMMAVRPDGKITLPLIGDVQAAGLTPNELSGQVREKLAVILREPRVNVAVKQVLSKRYTLVGAVNKPGAVPLVSPTTVLDAITSAGGLSEWAKSSKITILRQGQRIKFNYKDVLKGKNMEQNIMLQPGDIVMVPE